MDPEDSFIVRVGMFFLVLGGGTFILLVAFDLADKADLDYLFGPMILLAIGWSMWRKKPPPPPAGRFAYLKKMRKNASQIKQWRQTAKEEEKKKKYTKNN